MLYVIEDIGMRDYQEDRHSIEFNIISGIHYFGIFDGHGGDKVAIFMKMFFKEILRSALTKTRNQSIEQSLLDAFVTLQKLLPKDISFNCGSTALVILKKDTTLYIANVGDSRATMSCDNKAVPITEDHKPDVQSEYDRIVQTGGFVIKDGFGTPRVNGTLALSRAVGDLYLAPHVSWMPDIYTVHLKPCNKYLVAASDGLWDVFSNDDLISYIHNYVFQNGNECNKLCVEMLKTARNRGSTDNITIMLFAF